MILSYSIESIIRRFQHRSEKWNYSLAEWTTNGFLQLQRLGLEELGLGQWSGCDKSIPYTTQSTEIEPLDLSDPQHPRLPIPSKERSRGLALTSKTMSEDGLNTHVKDHDNGYRKSSDLVTPSTKADGTGTAFSPVGILESRRALPDTEDRIALIDEKVNDSRDQICGNDGTVEQMAIDSLDDAKLKSWLFMNYLGITKLDDVEIGGTKNG